ncbi:MAG: pitrilysin family protein [Candidatus Chromulinivorax sp.]|nr:pitrilysin family protein [Candidatus Chromulinivorax sp.]
MKRFMVVALLLVSFTSGYIQSEDHISMITQDDRIVQTQLDNGLTILVCPRTDVSTVSVQLWYNVGSKHEKDGEHGIAHFIEHMIFKGTEKISETDIPFIANKLSGYCNAFTSYDYTAYVFDIPVANWDQVLPIMADCMSNCTLRQDHLNSELKAVIQEMKMGKDNYTRNLWFNMITNIFESHPYHYTVLGFKQDLWTISRESLLAFYKKYYTPDNAVMVVVGNVDSAEVHKKVKEAFGVIPAGSNGWNTSDFFVNEDVRAKSVELYRDVQQSVCDVAYVMPGIVHKNQFELEAFGYVLANGKGSRLHKLLVDELQLVVDVHALVVDLFDHSMIFIEFHPKNETDIHSIVELIQKEIDGIACGNLTTQEIERAQRCAQFEHQNNMQKTQQQAYAIGQNYLAHKDPLYVFNYGNINIQELAQKIKDLAVNYCLPVVRHQGIVRAIPQDQKSFLARLQQTSDEQDTKFLDAKVRTSPVEDPKYASTIDVREKRDCKHAQPNIITLDNGLELVWFNNCASNIVECSLSLLVDNFYDADDKQGIALVVSKMLLEGTKNYPGQAFSDTLELHAIAMSVAPGSINFTCLQQDAEKALELLGELLVNASLTQESLEKIKDQVMTESKMFWDSPTTYCSSLARQAVYKDHPYKKRMAGTPESIALITLEDCVAYYKNMLTPQGACLSIVGDFADKNMCAIVEQAMSGWQGSVVEDLVYPELVTLSKQEILSPINRDQIVLAFTGLSVDRMHEDYDKILLFDQMLTGSALPSMDTRLFKLRMQSGLFYNIGGSLLFGATEQPGMIFIKTIVSNDRVVEAEQAILQVLDEAINTISEEELQGAKRSVIGSFDARYELNSDKVGTFLFLKRYNLPFDYFATRAENLQNITVEQIQEAVKKILSSDKLAVIKIGRVGEKSN